MPKKPDFSGYVTRNNVRCTDGRVIMANAFSKNDGKTVPLVWAHGHNDIDNILGHMVLENRADGVYGYAYFNSTDNATKAKEYVSHGDITGLSIWADQLNEMQSHVKEGEIREVSLVFAGANPGAYVDNVMSHGVVDDESAIIWFGAEATIDNKMLSHASEEPKSKEEDKSSDEPTIFNGKKTVADVIDSMTEEQKAVAFGLAEAMLMEGEDDDEDDEDEDKKGAKRVNGNKNVVKHNAFEGGYSAAIDEKNVISHELQVQIIDDAKRYGSMKESCIQHGITNVDYLFPEAKADSPVPVWYSRPMEWVSTVMAEVSRSPFSRIKSIFADITEDDARAKGYIKGKLKKEEVFSLLKRATTPTTVYKKQRMDRDDVIDITDFDVLNWLKSEMRVMLDEELARAFLFGDGRLTSSDDKINEQNIRPIVSDDDFYSIKTSYSVSEGADYKEKADAIVEAFTLARTDYKGSGNPSLFVDESFLTIFSLAQDKNGRYIYDTVDSIATKLRVNKIVSVPVIENYKGKNEGKLMGVMVNLRDYRVGADKGGAVNMFDDFDLDYNAMKYLIETRCSGALVVPKSAIVLEELTSA